MQKELTSREQVILDLLVEGLPPKEIAHKLSVSNRTVSFHRSNIYKKLGVHNIHELLAKRNSAGEYTETAISTEQKTCAFCKYKNNKLKSLSFLGTGILIGAVSILFVFWFFIKPSGSLAGTGVSNNAVSLPDGEVTLSDGTTFIVRTYDAVHLRAERWVDDFNDNHTGESCSSGSSIKLAEIYPAGIDKLIPLGTIGKIRISGTVDIEIHNAKIDIGCQDKSSSKYVWLGGTPFDKTISIGPGPFSNEIEIDRTEDRLFDLDKYELQPVDVDIQLIDLLLNLMLDDNGNALSGFDTGRRIPYYMPNGAIMATISNFKIEPVK